MPTRRLTFTNLKKNELNATNSVQEIEVPEGETHYHILFDDSFQKAEFIFHVRHPHSSLLLTGLIQARGEATPHLVTKIIHHSPETRAETHIKTLVSDSAAPRYEGLIHIQKYAQNCESYLNHHSLLLGATAKSWTLPSLQIEANRVKCSHAATVRTIREADLFYLRSRGLEQQSAEDVLVEAFTNDL